MSAEKLREQRIKQVTAFAGRVARNQITEAEKAFAPLGTGDAETAALLWEAYIAHMVGRLFSIVGTINATAILRAAITGAGETHDH